MSEADPRFARATSDHYETLGVARDATEDQIRAGARRAASQAHPDRKGGSHERMQAVNKARDVLLDPERRARYDAGEGDQPARTTDTMARDMMLQIFAAALDNDDDPVQAARSAVTGAKRALEANTGKVNLQIAKLKRRQGTVKTKNGAENHVEALIADKLAKLERETAFAAELAAVHKRVSELLDDYEGPAGMFVPAQDPWQQQQNAWTFQAFGGQR